MNRLLGDVSGAAIHPHSGVLDPKVRDIAHGDLANYAAIEADLTGFDACFFCLGVSAAGMKEADYERITYGITLAAAETLSRLNPQMTFIYVSGEGTDSTRYPGRSCRCSCGPSRPTSRRPKTWAAP